MDKKKYLIFGINGMAGHVIGQYLKEKGHLVAGFAKQESPICKTVIGDARNVKDIENALKTASDSDVVVNCIGVLNRQVDKKLSDGIYLNSVLPHFLAEKLKDSTAKLIHISTDCVYEGTRGKYTEKDFPDSISYYGRTKSLGEVIDDKNLTLRTSIVGPELKADGIGLFHWFMSQRGPVEGYRKVIWSGVTTLQLAKAIEEDRIKQQTGLYHLVNNKTICKYDLLNLFNLYCRNMHIEIIENNTIVSDRSIMNTKNKNIFSIPGYEEMVIEMMRWIKNHPELYQQYRGV